MIAPLMQRFGLGERWVYRDAKRECWGLSARRVRNIISKADVLLNLSGVTWYEGFERIPVRIFVDEDPGFTQINAAKDPKELRFLTSHTHFFSYGSNIGQPACRIPTLGLPWKICCQPVVLREWPMSFESRAEYFTTVMKWASYDNVRYRGETYGQKNDEFSKIEGLPSLTRQSLEVAVDRGAPLRKLKTRGWHIADPLRISRDVDAYRDYLQRSRGELSIAKNGYVKTGSGWFSDRSATYLASGKPVISQDTGYSAWLPVGRGLLPFTNKDEAAAAIDSVNSDYRRHCQAARGIAEEYFESGRALRRLLDGL
jgi:hypothetical protein